MSAAGVHLEHDWFPEPLPAGVRIGAGSYVYSSFAFIHCRSRRPEPIRIGRNSGVYDQTFFDLGPDGEVEIGDYCTLVGPVFSTNGRVRVGSCVLAACQVVIADHFAATPGDAAETPVPPREPSEIVIGDNCWLGTRCVLLAGARLGQGVIVGAGAVVNGEVPEYAIVAGNPAAVVAWARPGASPARA